MAVGTKFDDPETQAAIAAQVNPNVREQSADTTPAVEPKEADSADSDQKVTEQEPTDKVETPESSKTPDNKDAPSDTDDTDMSKVTPPSQEEVDKALEKVGFSNEKLGQELHKNDGKLTPETVATLKEHFGEVAVNNAVADMEKQYAESVANHAKQEADANTTIDNMNDYIYGELAGGDVGKGKDNLKILSDWAKDNIDKDTLSAINAKLASGNKVVVKEGLQTAVNLWKKGQERPMMTGDSEASNQQDVAPKLEPMSRDEFIQIQMTDKYQKDPEYAKKVDDRRRATMSGETFFTPEYHAKYRPAIR